MSVIIYLWISICLATLAALVGVLRRDRISLGLPMAYLLALLLIHLPGAWVYASGKGIEYASTIEIGIRLTAIGAISFVIGVWFVRLTRRVGPPKRSPVNREFWVFCVTGGWLLVYGISIVLRLPTVGAIVEKGGAIWMLGVMLGLASALRRKDLWSAAVWGSCLVVYPALMLILGGFMSYGSTVIIIVGSLLIITTRNLLRVWAGLAVVSFMALTVFANYFVVRETLRDAVWGGAPMSERIDIIADAAASAKLLDIGDPAHAKALDDRLNQNYFVGVAAERLASKQVDYLHGRSVWEGVLALIPRAVWPDKPFYSGSGTIVVDLTGLSLATNTSWGVGNVMEFYVNFGLSGVIGGFLLLGGLMGWLDMMAASAIRSGRLGDSILYFLPAVALIQPNGSIIELTGGAGAALAAAFVWRSAWRYWLHFRYAGTAPAPPRRIALSRP